MLDQEIFIRWYTRAFITVLDEELIALLSKAGCEELLLSIDKFNTINSMSYSRLIAVFTWAKKYKLNITFCYVIGSDENEHNLRWLFNTIFDHISNSYIHFEFTLFSFNSWNDKIKEESICSSLLMKGIDFLGENIYFLEDIKRINEHPILFSNFYTKKRGCEINTLITKYSIHLFRYFRRSFENL